MSDNWKDASEGLGCFFIVLAIVAAVCSWNWGGPLMESIISLIDRL